MAYIIRRSESVSDEVRRVLVEQNQKALSFLDLWQANHGEQIHAARQAFKRLRALLRLIRRVAPYVYKIENRFYRDLARSLACVRDTDAVIEAVTFLERGLAADPESLEPLRFLRAGLERRAEQELADPALDVPRRVQSACDALRDAGGRLGRTPLPDVTRKVLRKSVQKSMRRCEAGFGHVLMTQATADFHEWRRDVKCAYHQSRLMEELMADWARTYGPPLARLGEVLGHNQDLSILDALIGTAPGRLGLGRHTRHLRRLIGERQESLQDEARRLGVLIFLQREPLEGVGVPVGDADKDQVQDNSAPVAADVAAGDAPSAEPMEERRASPPDNLVDFTARKTGSNEPA